MKKLVLWSSVLLVAVLSLAIYLAFRFGEVSPIFAQGSISLAPDLLSESHGIRTLYITVFDAQSPMPMPYGAMVEHLNGDISEGQEFFSFLLTKENLRVMNPDRAPPQFLRIKARLDRDGMGGADQPGDLVGEINQVAIGQKNVALTISHKIN